MSRILAKVEAALQRTPELLAAQPTT